MRNPLMSIFYKSPFQNLKRHADKVSECARMFNKAVTCHLDGSCTDFDYLTDEVAKLESEADAIKRNIRGHLPKGLLMPVDKFQLYMCLREMDSVIDAVEESLYWLSYRPAGVTEDIGEDLKYLTEKILPTIELLSPMVESANRYFKERFKAERLKLKSIVGDIRQQEHEADYLERELIHKIFTNVKDPMEVFFLIRLVETVGRIADHAQNASELMRAMVAE